MAMDRCRTWTSCFIPSRVSYQAHSRWGHKRLWTLILAFGLAAGTGCETYRPKPITAQSVDQALAQPDADRLRVAAGRLRHPILRPLTLELTDGLSPDEAAVLAVLINPSLRAIRDQRRLAKAQLLQAGILPNPQLGFDLDAPVAGTTAGAVLGWGLGLSWDISALVTHGTEVQSAEAQAAAVDLEVAWQEWQVAQAARLEVLKLVGLGQQLAVAGESVVRLADNLALVRRAVSGGLMLVTDLAAAEAAAAQARAEQAGLELQTSQQRLLLNQTLGLAPEVQISLQVGIALPDHLALPTQADILADLENRRLDLAALRLGYESQEAAVHAAILGQFPKINIGLTSARDTGDVISVGFGISVDLPLFDHNQAAIARERATRQTLFDEYVARIFEARSQVASLLDNARGLELQLQISAEAERGLQALVETYRLALARGQVDVLSYNQALSDWTAKRMELIALRQQLAQTGIALEITAGAYRLEALGRTPPADAPAKEEDR